MPLCLWLDSLKSARPLVARRRSGKNRSRQLRDVRLAFETLEVRSLLSGTPLTAIPGTAGLWHLDEGAGSTTADTGGAHPGSLTNGAQWETGNLGNALTFDGVDDYVLLNNGAILGSAPNFTVEAWVRWDGGGTTHQHQFIYSEGSYNDIIDLYLDNGKPSFTTLGANWYTASAAAPLPVGEWHHLAGVLQAGVGGTLYVDGQAVATNANMGPGSQFAGSTNIGRFAGNLPGGYRFFRGTIDEVRILTVARSAAEIQADYQQGLNADPEFLATGGFTFVATAGTLSADQTVATFTGPGGAPALASYVADIDWGDGSASSPGTISFSDNVFTVSGSHLYAEPGSYNVVTTILEVSGAQTGDVWATRAVMSTPRWASSAGAIDGVIYVAGGYNGSHLQTVQAYDTATNTWINKNNKPAVQTNAAYGVINGVLYTAGGTNNSVEISSLYAYHPTTDTWTAKAAVPGVARQNSGGAVAGDLFYVMGGFSLGNPTNHNYAYNPAFNSWSAALAPLPTARTGLAVAAVNGTLYAIGGFVAGGGVTTAVEAYDPVSNTWTTKAAMPTARMDLDVAVVNGLIYAIGGTNLTTQFATVEAYDPATNAWTTHSSMPTARIALETVAVNDVIYAIGGYNSFPGSAALGTNESLTLGESSVSATSSAIVTPPNQPPVANAFGPYTVNEGGSVALDGSHSSDPEQASELLTYLWDLDGDGLFGESGLDAQRGDETGMFPVFSAVGLDGPSIYSVQLQVIDEGALSSNDVALLSITNWKPQANFGNDGPVNLGGPATVRFDNPSDLSPADAVAGFRYAFALDADSLALATYENSSPDAAATFSFADGLFDHTVYGRILDKDGGSSDYSTVVHSWLLTPPVATAGVPTGLIAVFRFTDNGSTHAGTIEWGDGAVSPVSTAVGSITQNADGSLSVWGNHTYLAAATGLNFSVRGTDDEDRYAAIIAVTAPIAVNTPPVANDDSVAATGTTVTLNVLANDTDANGDSLLVIGITQGTGGTAVINADGTLTYTVQNYLSAIQTFSYTVSDGQGGTATAQVTVHVSANAGLSVLATQVSDLGLNGGNTNSLLAKLRAAQNSLASGNPNAAINQLNAFENSVAALVRSGRLSAAAADLLSLQIQTILAGIGPS